MSLKETSKFISLILRHKPDVIGITLDEHGWANVDELIAGVSKTHPLTTSMLEQIVAEDEKQRYLLTKTRRLSEPTRDIPFPLMLNLKKKNRRRSFSTEPAKSMLIR